jgi:dolichol-phosphate mannosyltransferase
MPLDNPSLSVIVPTLNEEENIEGIIQRILAGGASLPMEIIVVDDSSRDDTQPIVRRLAKTLPVTLLARENPKDGLAGAVLAGARAAQANVVMVIDADGSHPPEKIPELARPVINGELDMVIGSRYAPGGSTPGWSRKRRLMSRAASACAWPLTDVHDALSGFFAVRKELMAEIPSDAAGFKIALEILVRGGDSLRVGEVPIAFRDRELGQSKMGAGVILTYFRRLVALSGWRESQDPMGKAITKTLLVWAVDFAAFAAAWLLHSSLGTANLIGFAVGAVLNATLKLLQMPEETRRSRPFRMRLLFVSMLAFFLRSGVLGTCSGAFGWPALAAVAPAIITGWAVLFLGYALFIWPVREQYGAGVRWRVAAIGAAAYLFVLRAVYLYRMPIDKSWENPPDPAAQWLSPGNRITLGLRHLGTAIAGPSQPGFNIPGLLCWSIAAWAIFDATRRILDKTTAFRALLLFSVLPVYFFAGAEFGPETVLITAWALLLWLMTFLTRGKRGRTPAAVACALAVAIFWWPSAWMPGWPLQEQASLLTGPLIFILAQLLLVTPAAIMAVARYYLQWRTAGHRIDAAAAIAAAIALLSIFYCCILASTLGLLACGAIWLPLLPFIASEMQRPGAPPDRWWTPTIYACIAFYGLFFYYITFCLPF